MSLARSLCYFLLMVHSDTLCADDGTDCSLLAASPPLPQSPYHVDRASDSDSEATPSFTKYY